MENIFVEFLPPWVETGLQPAFYDKESGSVLQQTARMYARVNMLIRMFNKLSKQTKETVDHYVEEFTTLYNYVHDYFDNLDVQEEINNKLDVMAEDGTLASILENYVFKELDVSDNFTVTTTRVNDEGRTLTYWRTVLKPNTEKISYVPLKGQTSKDTLVESSSSPINMFEFSTKVNSIFMSNADSSGSFINTAIVRDGVVLNEGGNTNANVLTIDNEGTLNLYDGTITGTTLVSDYNVVNSWGCSSWIIDGQKNINTSDPVGEVRHPRTVLLQEYNSKDIIFLHIEGRRPDSVGVTFDEGADLILSIYPNVRMACSVGGGGDSQLMIKGRMINDSNDSQLRPLYDVFYLDPNIEPFNNEASSEIGNARLSDVTMRDFLKSRINLTETYLSAKRILKAKFSNYADYENRFICELDYNTTLNVDDTILVEFPDISTIADINTSGLVTLNIHYAGSVNQPIVKDENGYGLKPDQISKRTVLLRWDGTYYHIVKLLPTIGVPIGSENSDLDNIKDYSILYSNNFTHRPTYMGQNVGGGVEITMPLPITNYYIQLYMERPSKHIYMRCCENGTWNAWNRMADNKGDDLGNKDLDTEVIDNIYIGYGNNMVNRPTGVSNGWAINIPGGTTGYNCQIYIDRETDSAHGNAYIRLEEGGVWNNWKKLALDS